LAWVDNGNQPGGFGALRTGYTKNTLRPIALLVDEYGRVWVTSLKDRVQLLATNVRYLLGIGGSGQAWDSKRFLYLADAGNQRIQEFEISNP
jgi:hypothetical protein